jgi:hypothetical protein
MKRIRDFFEYLSERLWDENNLSDITYSLIKSDLQFKSIFFEYCFGENCENIEIMEREYSKGNSRTDFYFLNIENNKKYILEVKIYDKNIHPEYKNIFKNSMLSFIANYNANGEPYYAEKTYDKVNTWHNFIHCLDNKTKKYYNPLINGYIIYLKKVTHYLEANKMNLKNTKSLIEFNTLLEKIIKNIPEKQLEINNNKKSYGIDFYGKNVKYKKGKKYIEFWIGVYFDNPDWDPFVSIEYENFTGKNIGEYYYIEDDPQWIYLKDELNKKLNNNKEKIEEQENILSNFIIEFLNNL